MTQPRKSIYITGGASGIGRAAALLFHENGWFVGAADRNEEGLASLSQDLKGDCLTHVVDVRKEQDLVKALEDFGARTGGTLDIMFNNAGIGLGGYVDEMPYEDIMRILEINFLGVVHGVRAAMPLLKATPDSLCFQTSSSSACFGVPHAGIYSATKSAVKGLTEALSLELRRHGVRAADVLPGIVDTPLMSREIIARLPKTGMYRPVEPAEVAQALWSAYHEDKERLHWFVPREIGALYRASANDPEAQREATLKGSGQAAKENESIQP